MDSAGFETDCLNRLYVKMTTGGKREPKCALDIFDHNNWLNYPQLEEVDCKLTQ